MADEQRKMTRVCIFPCGSEIGLEIQRSVAGAAGVSLVGASSVSSNHGPYVFREYHEGLPFVSDPGFVPAFNAFIDTHQIDYVFPAHDDAVVTLAEQEEVLHCQVVGSPAATCQTCRSKRSFYAHMGGSAPVPLVYHPAADIPYPVFVKPDRGQGSKGAALVNNDDELRVFLSRDPSLVAAEYLPGPEYTVDCFTDRHGHLRFSGARERIRVANGISVHTRPVDNAPFQPLAEAINDALVFRGPWFFQAKKRASGELVLIEAAPRVSGSMGLYRVLGVNFALLGLYDRMGYDVELLVNDLSVEMDRALFNRYRVDCEYRRVYIDLDDTILDAGGVNPFAMAFLHQCRARGITLHLVTRHALEPMETLRPLGLECLFDAVHHVTGGECKSTVIEPGAGAIFIDDSFAERKRVHEATGMPVFGADALEALIDWRR